MFLSRHKKLDCLGHLMIKSVTIFATDSLVPISNPEAGRPDQQRLVKWPVLIWKIVPFRQAEATLARQFDQRFLRSNGDHRLDSDGIPEFPLENNDRLAKDYVSAMPRVVLPLESLRAANQTPGNMVYQF